MPAEQDQQPIGDPAPMLRKEMASIFFRISNVIVVVVTGIVAFGFFLVPTRTSGATRSGKLRMQERQREINQTVPAPGAAAKAIEAPEITTPSSR